MIRERVRALLEDVAAGAATVDDALARLASEPFEVLGHTTVDHHRAVRQGYPEVVYGAGKTAAQVQEICASIAARTGRFLVTRASDGQRQALAAAVPGAIVNEPARTVRLGGLPAGGGDVERRVLVVTAGTSDLPVAEEAVETLHALCIGTDRLTDVGVAGIHRLLSRTAVLEAARAVIVVAGMDGALPSVVGGIVRVPVIAVPTSVGYGASFGGLAALLTMLNSCAAGVTVCNIDNGFGAAMSAARAIGG
ncbi:MAG TPA: nickel pincer cofactor biosynthesis protein LarB [Gemmatimonadaceae bacterium]|nr:nickel pincer cofactor biosynthesis protein LarB [Gemmatimonadaceae bacterium]